MFKKLISFLCEKIDFGDRVPLTLKFGKKREKRTFSIVWVELKNLVNRKITEQNIENINLQKIKAKSNPSLSCAWPSSAPACSNYFLSLKYYYLNP